MWLTANPEMTGLCNHCKHCNTAPIVCLFCIFKLCISDEDKNTYIPILKLEQRDMGELEPW